MTTDDATTIIDKALAACAGRQLVSTDEVTDLLLDIRNAIEAPATFDPDAEFDALTSDLLPPAPPSGRLASLFTIRYTVSQNGHYESSGAAGLWAKSEEAAKHEFLLEQGMRLMMDRPGMELEIVSVEESKRDT